MARKINPSQGAFDFDLEGLETDDSRVVRNAGVGAADAAGADGRLAGVGAESDSVERHDLRQHVQPDVGRAVSGTDGSVRGSGAGPGAVPVSVRDGGGIDGSGDDDSDRSVRNDYASTVDGSDLGRGRSSAVGRNRIPDTAGERTASEIPDVVVDGPGSEAVPGEQGRSVDPVGGRAGQLRGVSAGLGELREPGVQEPRVRGGDPVAFVADGSITVPSRPRERFAANLRALETIALLDAEYRYASAAEQKILAGWSSWGALPEVFDASNDAWATERSSLRALLDDRQWDAAQATTINAHYTDPAVAKAVWDALELAGFNGGRVIEPGSGAGTFIGAAPDTASMIGVELDPVSAKISSYLYPDASIQAYGYEDVVMPERSLAAAVGNVPFGKFSVYDPYFNPNKRSIHNHFILKSLRLVAPGGYAAFVTTKFTMDAKTSAARREIAKYGELVSAVRLPNGAFNDVAGTDVIADVLVFRRIDELKDPVDASSWINTSPLEQDADDVQVNNYFLDKPDNVLGELGTTSGPFGAELMVTGTGENVAEALAERLTASINVARLAGKEHRPALAESMLVRFPEHLDASGLVASPPAAEAIVGTIRANAESEVLERFTPEGEWQLLVSTGKQRFKEHQHLIELKDSVVDLISAQRAGQGDTVAARAALLASYERYVAAYGPINRFEWTEVKRRQPQIQKDLKAFERAWREELGPEDAGLETPSELAEQWLQEASRPESVKKLNHLSALRSDPFFGALISMEDFDEETMESRPGRVLRENLFDSQLTERTASTAAEALAISMAESRSVDLERIANLLGCLLEEAREQLGTEVFADPETDALLPAVQYLSGELYPKLDKAQAAVDEGREEFRTNVDALQDALPQRLNYMEIKTKPGGTWIENEDYVAFCREVLQVDATVDRTNEGRWIVQGPAASKFDVSISNKFSGGRFSPVDVLEKTMNNRSLVVRYKGSDDKYHMDKKATMWVRTKQEKLVAEFADWLYSDEARRDRVVDAYNRQLNGFVDASYKSVGEKLELPGLAGIEPHPYQRTTVARILNEQSVLMDQVVGSGKTGTITMAAMELRRLKLARKPWIVVPNHLVEQWTREFCQWYPGAKVLSIPSGLTPENRATYVAMSATGDWDAVIVPFTTFERIGIEQTKQQGWLAEDLSSIENEINERREVRGKKTLTVKALEASKKRLEKQHRESMGKKDDGFTFEQSGCDYLFVDEAHNFKNLKRNSDFQELSHSGSKRATDLEFKLRSLREQKAEEAELLGLDVGAARASVCTFATGTPVSNSIGEWYVMMRFLRPDLLEKMGMRSIDAWANQFTNSVSAPEVNMTGNQWTLKERIAKFQNVPELLRVARIFTETVTKDDLVAPLPELVGGKRRPVVRDASAQVLEFMEGLADRLERLPGVEPTEDNHFMIGNDARSVSLSPEMMGLVPDADGGRIQQVTDETLRIWNESKGRTYKGAFDADHPTPGGLQLLFCDRGVPNDEGRFDMYAALADRLVAGGMPRSQIALIGDATSDDERADLFERCRNGSISVLIGSTERMGTGTNVQERCIALHHVDIPWRPSDLEQREGRIIRQGNQNGQVEILNYITQGTFDAYQWQIILRKSAFIEQLKKAGFGEREVEDLDAGLEMNPVEMMAIATGKPELMEFHALTQRYDKLSMSARGHRDELRAMRNVLTTTNHQLKTAKNQFVVVQRLIDGMTETRGDSFRMTVDGIGFDTRSDAGRAVQARLSKLWVQASKAQSYESMNLCVVGGVSVTAAWAGKQMTLTAGEGSGHQRIWTPSHWENPKSIDGLALQLENFVTSLRTVEGELRASIETLESKVDEFSGVDLYAPFPDEGQLIELGTKISEMRIRLNIPADSETDMLFDEDFTERDMVADPGVLKQLYGNLENMEYRLHEGDVLQAKGKRQTWRVLEVEADAVTILPTQAGDHDNPARKRIFELRDMVLIERAVDQLTTFERAVVQASSSDEVHKGLANVRVDETVSVLDHRGNEVHGTVVERLKNNLGRLQGIVVRTAEGENVNVEDANSVRVVRHEVHDAEALAAQAAEEQAREHSKRKNIQLHQFLPGDVLLEDVEGLGQRGYVNLAENNRRRFVDPADRALEIDGYYTAREVKLHHGREITGDEINELGWTAVGAHGLMSNADKLRVGDRAMLTSINKKATIDEEIIVTDVSGSSKMDISYLQVQSPWERPRRSTLAASTEVEVLGRRFGALSSTELMVLSNPGREHNILSVNELDSAIGRQVGMYVWNAETERQWATLPDYRTGQLISVDKTTGRFGATLIELEHEGGSRQQYNTFGGYLTYQAEGAAPLYPPAWIEMPLDHVEAEENSTVQELSLSERGAVVTEADTAAENLEEGKAESETIEQVMAVADQVITENGAIVDAEVQNPPIEHAETQEVAPAPDSGAVENVLPAGEPALQVAPAAEEPELVRAALVISNDVAGTSVTGTERGSMSHQLVKDAGFRWSRNEQLWYLPRSWKEATRTSRVRQLVASLEREKISYTLGNEADESSSHVQLRQASVDSVVTFDPQGLTFDEGQQLQGFESITGTIQHQLPSATMVRIDHGERSWPLWVDHTQEVPAAMNDSRQELSDTQAQMLDSVLGVEPEQVPVGAVVSMNGYEFLDASSLMLRERRRFDQVHVAEVHSVGEDLTMLAVNVSEAETQLILMPPTRGRDGNRVSVHRINGDVAPLQMAVPQIRQLHADELKPGMNVTFRGVSNGEGFIRKVKEYSGTFLGVDENSDVLTVNTDQGIEDAELIGNVVWAVIAPEIEQDIPDVSEVLAKTAELPVLEQEFMNAPARSKTFQMMARHVAVGSVLVNSSGLRGSVWQSTPLDTGDIALELRPVGDPRQSTMLVAHPDSYFTAEPLPLPLGRETKISAHELTADHMYFAVWWDQASEERQLLLGSVTDSDTDPNQLRMLVTDGSGKTLAYRIPVDMELTIKAVDPKIGHADSTDAVTDSHLEMNLDPGHGMMR